jgi:DNA-3-methyladenine glycosylase II
MKKLVKWNYDSVLDVFQKKDPKLAALVANSERIVLYKRSDYFVTLCSSIISQQISVKAADSIYRKFVEGIGGELTPAVLLRFTPEQLRELGISNQKAGYLLDIAKHFSKDPEKYEHLDHLSNEEVIAALIHIKGVGRWTAQMFLMFTLGRLDVFAPDDLGLKNAMIRLYNWKGEIDKMKLEKQAAKWSPYQTIAARYLWQSLNNAPKPKETKKG